MKTFSFSLFLPSVKASEAQRNFFFFQSKIASKSIDMWWVNLRHRLEGFQLCTAQAQASSTLSTHSVSFTSSLRFWSLFLLTLSLCQPFTAQTNTSVLSKNLISIQGWRRVIITLHYFIQFYATFSSSPRRGPFFFAAFRPTEKHRKSFFNFPQFFCHLCHVKIYMTSYSIFFSVVFFLLSASSLPLSNMRQCTHIGVGGAYHLGTKESGSKRNANKDSFLLWLCFLRWYNLLLGALIFLSRRKEKDSKHFYEPSGY